MKLVRCACIAYIAALAAVDAFTTRRSYHRPTSRRPCALKLSKKEQEVLWEANAGYLDASVKHITSNTWPRSSFGRKLRKRAARPYLLGVEIRLLETPHPLHGELGLLAASAFHQFDIVGEYSGEVYDTDGGGEYATYLESRDEKYALGVDASKEGNECRFINHFAGISDEPNVVMKNAYVEELPRVLIVCMRDIAVGEEFLLKYSDEYVEEYIATSQEEQDYSNG